MELQPIEVAVIQMMLRGEHPLFNTLRYQSDKLEVKSRESSSAGFYTEFSVPSDVPKAVLNTDRVKFGDVVAELPELKHGVGFLLYIQDGYISMLEGYTFEEPFPGSIKQFDLKYSEPSRDKLNIYISQVTA